MKKNHLYIVLIGLLLLVGCTTKADVVSTEPSEPTMTSVSTSPTPTLTSTPLVLPYIRTPEVRPGLPAEGVAEFHIIHWNDFHGELVEHMVDGAWVPGAARIAAFIKTEKASYQPGQVILLDGGDWFEGSTAGNKTGGTKVLEFFQRLGVTALVVGNHEFFMGADNFFELLAKADPIEFLSANMRVVGPKNTCTDQPIVNAYQIYELGTAQGPKARVAVIGVSGRFSNVAAWQDLPGICFQDKTPEVIKIYDQLKENENPDVIILLTHNGIELDRTLAQELNAAGRPVDMIIGAHTHSWMEVPEKIGKTVMVTTPGLGRTIGVLDITFNRASGKLDVNWRQEVFDMCSPEDADTLAFLQDTIPTPMPGGIPVKAADTDPSHVYLMDLQPVSEAVGYWTLGKGTFPGVDAGMVPCMVIESHGVQYPRGLFVHAPSKLVYALDGKYFSFETEISIKETACGDGAAFVVDLDGRQIYRSETITADSDPLPVTLDVTGGKLLSLETDSGADVGCDWTIWGDPYLVKAP